MRVDLPTLGRPIRATNPDRNPGGGVGIGAVKLSKVFNAVWKGYLETAIWKSGNEKLGMIFLQNLEFLQCLDKVFGLIS